MTPAGSLHSWASARDEGALVRIVFTRGAGIEEPLRCAREGRVNAKGMPPSLVTARLSLLHQMDLAGRPVPLQCAAFRMLTAAARLLCAE